MTNATVQVIPSSNWDSIAESLQPPRNPSSSMTVESAAQHKQVPIRKGTSARIATRSPGDQVSPNRSRSAAKKATTIHPMSASKIHNSSLRVFIRLPPVRAAAVQPGSPNSGT